MGNDPKGPQMTPHCNGKRSQRTPNDHTLAPFWCPSLGVLFWGPILGSHSRALTHTHSHSHPRHVTSPSAPPHRHVITPLSLRAARGRSHIGAAEAGMAGPPPRLQCACAIGPPACVAHARGTGGAWFKRLVLLEWPWVVGGVAWSGRGLQGAWLTLGSSYPSPAQCSQ